MARHTTVETTDDLTGENNAEEVRFGIDGSEWTIDLAAASRDRLDKALTPYLDAARRTGHDAAPQRPRIQSATAARESRRAIRRWWAGHEDLAGQPHTGYGRIPNSVIRAYEQQGNSAPTRTAEKATDPAGRAVPAAAFSAASE
jgi:hypothetical protein